MSDVELVIHTDLLSQPVRAVVAFCKLNNIPFTPKYLKIFRGEHLTEEFEKITPVKQLPVIQEIDKKTG